METNAAEKWLRDTLMADVTLAGVVSTRVWNTRRPDGGAFPCVIFQVQNPGADFVVLGAVRMWSRMTYVVRGIAEQSSYEGTVKSIADRIDAVLHGGSGTNGSGTVYTCVRTGPFQMAEVVDGREFRHLGGVYQVQVR